MAMSFTVAPPYSCRKEFNDGLFAIEVADDKVSFVIEDEGYRWMCGTTGIATTAMPVGLSVLSAGLDEE